MRVSELLRTRSWQQGRQLIALGLKLLDFLLHDREFSSQLVSFVIGSLIDCIDLGLNRIGLRCVALRPGDQLTIGKVGKGIERIVDDSNKAARKINRANHSGSRSGVLHLKS